MEVQGIQDGDYLCWNEARNNKNGTVKAGDVALALKWFIKETGEMPTAVRLNPRLAHMADGEIPRGIPLQFNGGTAPGVVDLRYRTLAHG